MKNKIMKVLFILIICLVSILCIDDKAYAATATVEFGSEVYDKIVGETFPIGVYIKGDVNIGKNYIKIQYDSDRLEYISGAYSVQDDIILVRGDGGKTSVKYWLTFKVIAGGNTSIRVTTAQAYTNDSPPVLFNVLNMDSANLNLQGEDLDKSSDDGSDVYKIAGSEESNQVVDTELNNNSNIIPDGSSTDLYSSSTENDTNEENLSNDDSREDLKEKNGNISYILEVIKYLFIIGGSTAICIYISTLILNKRKRKYDNNFDEFYDEEYYEDEYYDENMVFEPINEMYGEQLYAGEQLPEDVQMGNISQFNQEQDALLNRQDMNYSYAPNGGFVEVDNYESFVDNDTYVNSNRPDRNGRYNIDFTKEMMTKEDFNIIKESLEKQLEEQVKEQLQELQF